MLRQVDRCVVKDNTIVCSMKKRGSKKDSGAAGVYIFNGSRNRIENNSIKNLVKTGYGSEMSGIIVCDRSNRNVITSNRINNASRYGITIYDDNCKNNRIRGNVIKNCGRADLNVHGTNVVE
jgi:parallel beta-helix repeat protein